MPWRRPGWESPRSCPALEISQTELEALLGEAIAQRIFVPIFVGSTIIEQGVNALMDDIVDYMNAIASGLDLFNVNEMRKEGPQMANLTLTAVKDIHVMIDHLPDYKKDTLVMEKAIAVGHIEDEGDLVYQNALRRLFQEEPNGRYTVTWTRLFDQMENLLDACDNTAGVVRSVVLKGA